MSCLNINAILFDTEDTTYRARRKYYNYILVNCIVGVVIDSNLSIETTINKKQQNA